MSHVTDVILTMSLMEETGAGMIGARLSKHSTHGFLKGAMAN